MRALHFAISTVAPRIWLAKSPSSSSFWQPTFRFSGQQIWMSSGPIVHRDSLPVWMPKLPLKLPSHAGLHCHCEVLVVKMIGTCKCQSTGTLQTRTQPEGFVSESLSLRPLSASGSFHLQGVLCQCRSCPCIRIEGPGDDRDRDCRHAPTGTPEWLAASGSTIMLTS